MFLVILCHLCLNHIPYPIFTVQSTSHFHLPFAAGFTQHLVQNQHHQQQIQPVHGWAGLLMTWLQLSVRGDKWYEQYNTMVIVVLIVQVVVLVVVMVVVRWCWWYWW